MSPTDLKEQNTSSFRIITISKVCMNSCMYKVYWSKKLALHFSKFDLYLNTDHSYNQV